MARKKSGGEAKQGPPFQFRPGVELESLVASFAALHGMTPNEACKVLVALAVTAMDVRYYALMHQLAEAMGGSNAFVRACTHVLARLEGAALADLKYRYEPDRSRLILAVVREFLAGKGLLLPEMDLWFAREAAEQHAEGEEQETSRSWSSFDQEAEGERQRERSGR